MKQIFNYKLYTKYFLSEDCTEIYDFNYSLLYDEVYKSMIFCIDIYKRI